MANQPDIIPMAWAANNSTADSIPETTSESGKASWDQGFPVETSLPLSQGGVPPKYGDFNGILKILSQFALYAQQGGQYTWNNALAYGIGSIVLGADGNIYRAAQASTAVNPVGDSSGKWERVVSQSDLAAISTTAAQAAAAANTAQQTAESAQNAVTTLDGNVVHRSGNETISGIKTFTSEIRQQRADNLGVVLRCQNTSLTKGTPPDEQQNALIDLVTDKNYNRLSAIESIIRTNGDMLTRLYVFHNAADASDSANMEIYCYADGTKQVHAPQTIADDNAHASDNDVVTRSFFNDNAVHKTGNETISGIKTFSTEVVVSTSIIRPNDTGRLYVAGGSTYSSNNGARLILCGASESSEPGTFYLGASDSSNYYNLKGTTSGTLTWNNKEFVYTSGNQNVGGVKTFTGEIHPSNAGTWCRVYNPNVTKGTFPVGNNVNYWAPFCDKNGSNYTALETMLWTDGSVWNRLYVFENKASGGGSCNVEVGYDSNSAEMFRPSTNGTMALGSGGRRWGQIYSSNSTISTSDERTKSNITPIPDAVLDAWGDVNWSQFQFNNSIEKKGADKARLHNGLIAQRIDAVFKAHGLDASKYGLFCYDEWDATPAEYDEDGNIRNPAKEAGNLYSIRYEEALCMEAAYQRRRADRAEARIAALERRLDEMEAVLASMIAPVGDETFAGSEEEEAQA